jgi:hypothetical protein
MSRLCCALFGLGVWTLQPIFAGENAGVEIDALKISAPCDRTAGDLVEFSVSARHMSNVRQVQISFSWQPADAIVEVAAEAGRIPIEQKLKTPFPPQIYGNQVEYGMGTLGDGAEGMEGEALLATFGFKLAPHITPDTRVDIWVDEVSLGPNFSQHDIIRPLQGVILANYCDDDQQLLERTLFVVPEQADTSFSPAPLAQVEDQSAGETLFRARFLEQGFFAADQVFTWTIENQGQSPVYMLGEQVIMVEPGTSGQGASTSDQRGDAFFLVDAELGPDLEAVGMATVTACVESEGESICASSLITWWGDPPTAIQDETDPFLPTRLRLGQNYPNPFNAATILPFSVPQKPGGELRLEILNAAGQVVTTLLNGHLEPGQHQARWDGRDEHGHPLASGLYFYRVRLDAEDLARPMVLLR